MVPSKFVFLFLRLRDGLIDSFSFELRSAYFRFVFLRVSMSGFKGNISALFKENLEFPSSYELYPIFGGSNGGGLA